MNNKNKNTWDLNFLLNIYLKTTMEEEGIVKINLVFYFYYKNEQNRASTSGLNKV